MKRSAAYNKVFELISTLSSEERDSIVQEMMSKVKLSVQDVTSHFEGTRCDSLVDNNGADRPDCPHCGAKAALGYINKKGTHKGSQRYQCKKCGKKFISTTNTAFAYTRKNAETWRKFIELTICGKSLAECAEECDICIQTAFNWRHKLLNAFVANQRETKMTGRIEVDETLIPLSYKGNHVQGGFGARKVKPGVLNDMPREAYQRGSDNKSMSSKEKACVFCMVQDGNKNFYAAVPGVGFMTPPMLDATVAKHVDKANTMILADNYKVSQKYFETNGYTYTILRSNVSDNPHDHKPEIRDGLHLQHVNAMHHHLRNFLKPYCGVSSKYLEGYTALFTWLRNIKANKKRSAANTASVTRAATRDCYITSREIHSRSAIPQCA